MLIFNAAHPIMTSIAILKNRPGYHHFPNESLLGVWGTVPGTKANARSLYPLVSSIRLVSLRLPGRM